MKGLFNATSTACKNLWIEKWINILTVITLSACIMIAGICIIIPVNVHALIKTWVKDFGIVIYLKEDITNSEQQAIITRLEKDTDFRDLVFVSKDEALKKLQNYFSESDDFSVESLGTDSNPLPQSIELKFSRDTITPSFVEDKVSLIKTFSGVDDIQYGTEWLVIMSRFSQTLNVLGFILGLIIFIAIAFVMYSTIKIHIYRRNDEIKTLKLLGATKSFIRVPFIIEGSLIGIIGCILGITGLYGLYRYTKVVLPILDNSSIFLTPFLLLLLSVTTLIISFVGTFVAIGRLRY